jgi:hypothetical protein
MKHVFKIFGIIALITVIGFCLMGCPDANNPTQTIKDTYGDGIPDDTDQYPNDPTNTDPTQYIYSVKVAAADDVDSILRGNTLQFTATVTGTNEPAQTVTWSVEKSGKKEGTLIDETGKLTVAADEIIGDLIVRATSTVDTDTSGTKTITVKRVSGPEDFTFDPATGTITRYSGPADLIIPSTIDGVPVTKLGDSVFSNKYLTSVIIPEGITTINYQAFRSNKLTSITIPDSVTTIGQEAFILNELTSITIGADVDVKYDVSFYGVISSFDDGFEGYYNSNDQKAGTYMYHYDSGYPSDFWYPNSAIFGDFVILGTKAPSVINYTGSGGNVIIPSTINNIPVTAIANYAFENSDITSVIIPDTVTTIGESAFYNHQLTSIVIPNSVTDIGRNAFRTADENNTLTSITIGANVNLAKEWNGNAFGDIGFEEYYTNDGKQAGTYTRPDVNSEIWTRE